MKGLFTWKSGGSKIVLVSQTSFFASAGVFTVILLLQLDAVIVMHHGKFEADVLIYKLRTYPQAYFIHHGMHCTVIPHRDFLR